jgi:hypothetical protein
MCKYFQTCYFLFTSHQWLDLPSGHFSSVSSTRIVYIFIMAPVCSTFHIQLILHFLTVTIYVYVWLYIMNIIHFNHLHPDWLLIFLTCGLFYGICVSLSGRSFIVEIMLTTGFPSKDRPVIWSFSFYNFLQSHIYLSLLGSNIIRSILYQLPSTCVSF